jgi:DNA-binding GntR family transcriptional regulator
VSAPDTLEVTAPAVLPDAPVTPLALGVRPDSLTDAVYEAIRRGIIDRRLPPGAPVTEAALAAQLGVSKTPVREALLRLKDAGVIEPNGRRGGRVVQRSEAAIRRAYEVREALESYAAGRAAERADAAAVAGLRELAERSREHARANDVPAFVEVDGSFHAAIGAAAANPLLGRMLDDALTLAMTLRRRDRPRSTASTACADAHVRIAAAIAGRDAAAAEREMRAHIAFVAALVLSSPDQRPRHTVAL